MRQDVYLLPMTADMYHAYFKAYQNDLDLYIDKRSYTPYVYDAEKVNRYIQRQIDLKRKVLPSWLMMKWLERLSSRTSSITKAPR